MAGEQLGWPVLEGLLQLTGDWTKEHEHDEELHKQWLCGMIHSICTRYC